MSERFFASGSDGSRLSSNTRLECKICWHVYDPAEGDLTWQIPAGTAFTDLPEHWNCPECGATKRDFLVLED